MLYLTGIAVVFCLAGLLAERGLQRLGRPVRWVWVGAMAATVGLPLASALALNGGIGAGVEGVGRSMGTAVDPLAPSASGVSYPPPSAPPPWTPSSSDRGSRHRS